MSSKTSKVNPGSTLDNLPRSFVSSLRILFDILDEESRGTVLLSDIECRWNGDDDIQGLPTGVLESLRKVAPKSGLLSFERFCAGLKIALLRSRSDSNLKRPLTATTVVNSRSKAQHDEHSEQQETVRGRSVSMSHLERRLQNGEKNSTTEQIQQRNSKPVPYSGPYQNGPSNNKNTIADALRNWQKEQLLRTAGSRDPGDGRSSNYENPTGKREEAGRNVVGIRIGRSAEAPISTTAQIGKRPKNRRDARRHTVGNGIDYNMLKRMKELEQEKDILLQGLEMVDRAREWYHKHIVSIQDRQKYFNRSQTHNDLPPESYAERMKFQKARIFETNRQLTALLESSEKNFLTHMNLAMEVHVGMDPARDAMTKALKEQNRMLTQEVSKKSEKVTQLEREKQALIRELFEARAKNNPRDLADNSTFM
ncbi:suppressor APC domain-containing protein 2-like [Glandiceps talaboti]